MNNVTLTIFTPTYNRGYILEQLYKSLLSQNDKDFEWLIIDDGSQDNTKELVDKFIKDDIISIIYRYKKNEGKYRAINDAIDIANGKIFMVVDSDDWLTKDAVLQVKKYYNQIKDKDDFFGVVGLRGKNENEAYTESTVKEKNTRHINNEFYKKEYIDTDSITYRYKYKIGGDRAEVCITEKLKKYKFPEKYNEKFMGESVLWNSIANDGYKFRYFNRIIYITNYLPDGLSNNMKKIKKYNSNNTILECNMYLKMKKLPLIIRFKHCINYYRYSFFIDKGIRESFFNCNSKFLSLISIPISKIFKIK